MAAIAFSLVKQGVVGVACGLADILYTAICEKTCILAGVKFEEIEERANVPHWKVLDKVFMKKVVIYPIAEELIFRGALQPFLAKGFLLFMPQHAAPILMNVLPANVIAAVAVGIIFGAIHYFNYKSGGKQVVFVISIGGAFYGIIKERFGLVTSISAHMTHNFIGGWIDKHYPTFLNSAKETP